MDTRKLGAVSGIVGSVAFIAIFTIEGWLRPGYDAQRMFVSELALGPRGLVQILNFVACGFATILFARGMRAEFPAAPAATRLLDLVGVGLIGAGLFVMDPLTTPLGRLSWHHHLHGVFGAPVFYGAPIACLPLRPAFPRSAALAVTRRVHPRDRRRHDRRRDRPAPRPRARVANATAMGRGRPANAPHPLFHLAGHRRRPTRRGRRTDRRVGGARRREPRGVERRR
jgi:hypothetical protein